MKTNNPAEIVKYIKKVSDEKIKKIRAATKANAEDLARRAKRYAPKDLSKLSQSIAVFEDTLNKNMGVAYKINVSEKYAPYIEFGTGDKVEVPAGLEDWAMQFYVNGEGNIPAQPYLYPAFMEIRKQYLADLQDILDE